MNENYDKKTIMPYDIVKMYSYELKHQHEKVLQTEINNISATIEKFHGEKVTVRHCCTHNGNGYYTISNGKQKRFIHSEYRLECVGGVWSLYVYERLYIGQVYLITFLESVKKKVCEKFSAEMPLRNLYIAYILTDFDNESCYLEDKSVFETAREYQKRFTEKYIDQIHEYQSVVQKGGDFWDYYNGVDNYEYSCVSSILTNAVNEIYKNRKSLESCELWKEARKVIDILNDNCK